MEQQIIFSHNKYVYQAYNPELFDQILYCKIWDYMFHQPDGLTYSEAVIEMWNKGLLKIHEFGKLNRAHNFNLACQYAIDNNKMNNLKHKAVYCEYCPLKIHKWSCDFQYNKLAEAIKIIKDYKYKIEDDCYNLEYITNARIQYKYQIKKFICSELRDGVQTTKYEYDLERKYIVYD